MALQQLSSGGTGSAITPVDATSAAAQQQSTATAATPSASSSGGLNLDNPDGSFNLSQYNSLTSGISNPYVPFGGQLGTPQSSAPTPNTGPIQLTGAIGPTATSAQSFTKISIDPFTGAVDSPEATGFTGAWPGAKAVAGNPYPWDPFSFAGSGSSEGSPLQSEKDSPGYKQFGQTWLDLLNTISSQDLQWGGTNQSSGELKGGGSVGPWLSSNVITPYAAGDQNKALANSIDFISSQTGKPASDPQTQKLGGAFLDYTLQNANRYGANTQNFTQRKATEGNAFGEVLSDLGPVLDVLALIQPELLPLALAANLAAAGESFSEGNIAGGFGNLFGAISGGLGGGLAATGSFFGDVGQAAGLAAGGIGLGEGIASGNPMGILGGLASLGGSGFGIADNISSSGAPSYDTSLAGLNSGESGGTVAGNSAPVSSSVTSGIADTLGISQSDLTSGVDLAKQGIGAAGAAVPLIQKATAGDPNINIPAPGPPTPDAPAPQPAAPVLPVNAGGQALTPKKLANPAQNSQLDQILLSLGIPA